VTRIDFSQARGGVFYLHGEDLFRKDEAVREIVAAHLDPATKDFNFDPLRGTEVDPETLASVIATPPMMAEWRVVVVREMEGLASSKKAREILMGVAKAPPPGLALVLSCTVPQGSKAKLYRELAKLAQSVEFRAFSEADVPGWILARAREVHGIAIEVDAAQALAAAIGTNLGILVRELEKLTDFVGERKKITVADVEAAGTRLPAQDRWRWLDLVADRELERALSTLGTLMAQGENGVGLVIALTTQCLRLGIAAGEGRAALESALPPHQKWLAKRAVQQAKKWSLAEIDMALEGLLRVDRMLKSSPHSDEHFLEEWLLGMLARAEAA
jgi:DNA polymerase III subunit delta